MEKSQKQKIILFKLMRKIFKSMLVKNPLESPLMNYQKLKDKKLMENHYLNYFHMMIFPCGGL